MSEETKLVQFKAPRDRIEAWDRYVKNEPEYDDRSDLIRKSIERNISEDSEDTQNQDSIGRQEALENFERLKSMVSDLEREIEIVQGDIVNEDDMSDLVLNRSYRATKRVLEQNDIIEDDG